MARLPRSEARIGTLWLPDLAGWDDDGNRRRPPAGGGGGRGASPHPRHAGRARRQPGLPKACPALCRSEAGPGRRAAGGPKQSRVLAGACGAHPGALHTVLRALASLGILSHEADGSFGLAPLGRLLRTDTADSLRDQVVLEWEVFRVARDGLLQAVQTGEPAFSHVFGHGLFEHLARYPALSRTFDAHMVDLTGQAAASLLAVCRFAPASRIVDVGGGLGALLARILETCPDATGVVLDLPAVAEGARRHLAAAGLTSRCEVVGGISCKKCRPAIPICFPMCSTTGTTRVVCGSWVTAGRRWLQPTRSWSSSA